MMRPGQELKEKPKAGNWSQSWCQQTESPDKTAKVYMPKTTQDSEIGEDIAVPT